MKNLLLILFVILEILGSFDAKSQVGWKWASYSTGTDTVAYDSWVATRDNSGNIIDFAVVEADGEFDTITIGPDKVHFPPHSYNCAVTKTDSSGNFLWTIASESQLSFPLAIVTDWTGCIYLFGYYYDGSFKLGPYTLTATSYDYEYFLAKISPAGAVLWATNVCDYGSGGVSLGSNYGSMVIDKQGYLYLAGSFATDSAVFGSTKLFNTTTHSTYSDIFLAKFDNSGGPVWAKSFGGDNYDAADAMAITNDGSIFLFASSLSDSIAIGSAMFDKSYNGNIEMLMKFDTAGHILWAKSESCHTGVSSVVTDQFDNLYIHGRVDSTVTLGPDTVIISAFPLPLADLTAKIDSSGNFLWAHGGQSPSTSKISTSSIGLDSCGDVWVAGGFYAGPDSMNFEGHILKAPPLSNDPMYIVEYDNAGNYVQSLVVETGGDDAVPLVLDGEGSFYLVCDYRGPQLVLGADTLPAVGIQEQLYIAKYSFDTGGCPRGTSGSGGSLSIIENETNPVPQFEIFPNPVNAVITIVSENDIQSVIITNLLGQTMKRQYYHGKRVEVDVTGLPGGMYIARINNTQMAKFLKE
jgi:type IX secretion system substrate protein